MKTNVSVGVIDSQTKSMIPFRVFYPSENHDVENVGWFVNGFNIFVEGYMHVLIPKLRNNMIVEWIISWIALIVSYMVPMANQSLPFCSKESKPHKMPNKKYSLLVFSHGLTGTGEEHALMFAHWAQRGFVVACIHHCDGSSHSVYKGSNDRILYHHPPDLSNYDYDFRPNQVIKRESEIHEMLQYILHDKSFSPHVSSIINKDHISIGGFSYGAATASLSVINHPNQYKACILLDGWFYIEVSKGFPFPASVHQQGLHIPSLFIGSEQFAQRPLLSNATKFLADGNRHVRGSTCYVLRGTKHQNFIGRSHTIM